MGKEARDARERLDSHITELMTFTEKQCRMLDKNDYGFSPKLKHWLERGHIIRGGLYLLSQGKHNV